jgi:glutamyl-tRNA reductase
VTRSASCCATIYEAEPVAGTFVVSTCNRVEVYAEVDKFHAGLSAISDLLARHSGIPLAELTEHLYVRYEDRAVQHLLTVAAGLDSMVVGESQILGQVRQAIAWPVSRARSAGRSTVSARSRCARQTGPHGNRDRPRGREPGQRRGGASRRRS